MNRIPDDFWNTIKELIPAKKSRVGRPSKCNRQALEGIFYVMRNGSLWKMMPAEFGCASTVHGKFIKWARMGILKKILDCVLKLYGDAREEPDFYSIDASFSKAPLSYKWSGKSPTDRGKQGVKKSIIVNQEGIPVSIVVGAANTHDSKFFEENIKQLAVPIGTFRVLTADSAYDSKKLRKLAKEYGLALLASINRRRNKEIRPFYPKGRWVVERTFGWLHWYRGIKTCWAKTKESFLAFVQLAASLQAYRAIRVFG